VIRECPTHCCELSEIPFSASTQSELWCSRGHHSPSVWNVTNPETGQVYGRGSIDESRCQLFYPAISLFMVELFD
jgi:hypothetical protein